MIIVTLTTVLPAFCAELHKLERGAGEDVSWSEGRSGGQINTLADSCEDAHIHCLDANLGRGQIDVVCCE